MPVRLLVACLVVAGLGVGMAFTGRTLFPQIPAEPSAGVRSAARIDVMAHANPAARVPDHRVLRLLSAVPADLTPAARHAQRRLRIRQDSAAVAAPTVVGAPGTGTTSPAPVPVAASSPEGNLPAAEMPGPAAPPDPTDPNAQIAQP
jgi:Tfp pilus assembly protein FimV